MRRHGKYDGDASVNRSGNKVRVWIEAPNVTAETYISLKRARELRDTLNFMFEKKAAAGSGGEQT